MANQGRGEVTLEIGGKERIVAFDFNALADLEALVGISFLNAEQLDRHIGLRFIRDALSVGLSCRGQKISPKQVGLWLSGDMATIAKATTAVNTAIRSFFVGMGDESGAVEGASPSDPTRSEIDDG